MFSGGGSSRCGSGGSGRMVCGKVAAAAAAATAAMAGGVVGWTPTASTFSSSLCRIVWRLVRRAVWRLVCRVDRLPVGRIGQRRGCRPRRRRRVVGHVRGQGGGGRGGGNPSGSGRHQRPPPDLRGQRQHHFHRTPRRQHPHGCRRHGQRLRPTVGRRRLRRRRWRWRRRGGPHPPPPRPSSSASMVRPKLGSPPTDPPRGGLSSFAGGGAIA